MSMPRPDDGLAPARTPRPIPSSRRFERPNVFAGGQNMLDFFGRSEGKLCDGLSRRSFLRAGGLAVGGLTLADLLRLKAQAGATPTAGKAVIMVYLNGGPSHMDMYDLKPDAPVEYRGEFKPIKTNVAGMEIS